MNIHVFLGPTLTVEEARRELDAVYLPPAAMGDVYRAGLEGPAAIAIIDGVFDQAPAVAHKEVLWAMSEGIHVFGAASMGALRAIELHPFGMEGVGAIFEAFQSGVLTDDDEVAVSHASAEMGYRRLSEAMVDIRATLAIAEGQGVIDVETRDRITRIAKAVFYPDRCWPVILSEARRAGVPAEAVQALAELVRVHKVSQKREDALSLLRLLRERFSGPVPRKRVAYHFERTDAWEHIKSLARERPSGAAAVPGAADSTDPADALLDALAGTGELESALTGALARALAADLVERQGRAFEGRSLTTAIDAFRRDHGLIEPEEVARWIVENDVHDPERFFRAEAQFRWAQAVLGPAARRHVADHLRSTGRYAALARSARASSLGEADRDRVSPAAKSPQSG